MRKNKNTILIILCLVAIVVSNIFAATQRKKYTEEIIQSNDKLINTIKMMTR